MWSSLAFFVALRSYLALASPPVKVALRTSWPAPPLLLEIIECAAAENPTAYFGILDALTSETFHSNSISEQALYHSSLEVLSSHGYLHELGSRESFELSVALHSATPKIEAFYQHYTNLNTTAPSEDCLSYIDWYGDRICDAATLRRLVQVDSIDAEDVHNSLPEYPRPALLTIDHVYPYPSTTLNMPNRTAILYASLPSSNFRELHTTMMELSQAHIPRQIQYVLRYIPPLYREPARESYLSGYSVAMDLKKMDYLAMDDRRTRYSDDGDSQNEATVDTANDIEDEAIRTMQNLVESLEGTDKTLPLLPEEIGELGLRASQLILNATSPLGLLKHISQDFPKYALALGRRAKYTRDLYEEIVANQYRVGGGVSMLWLNGMVVQENDLNPFKLLNILRKERTIMRSLLATGLKAPQALDLITHRTIAQGQAASAVTDGIFDASDRPEGGNICVWFNDLTKDSRYSRWSSDVMTLKRPMYPGQFPNIRQNIWNVVLALDLSRTSSLHFISQSVVGIIQRSFPFRWGVVPLVSSEDSIKAARLFYYLIDNYGRGNTTAFFRTVTSEGSTSHLNFDVARDAFKTIVTQYSPRTEGTTTDFDSIVSGASEGSLRMAAVEAYAKRLALVPPPEGLGYAFVNGKFFTLDDDFFRNLQNEQAAQMEHLIGKIKSNEISENIDIANYFYDLPTSSTSRNEYIFPSSASNALRVVNLPDVFTRLGFDTIFHGITNDQSDASPLTMWIVADFDSPEGLDFAKEALKGVEHESGTTYRIAFVQNSEPESSITDESPLRSSHVLYLLSHSSESPPGPRDVLRLLDLLDSHDYANAPVSELFKAASFDLVERIAFSKYNVASRLVARELGFKSRQHGIIVNGRVIGPIQVGAFHATDFVTLATYESSKRVRQVVEALQEVAPELSEENVWASAVSMISSVISAIQIPDPTTVGLFQQQPQPRQRVYRDFLQGSQSSFRIGDNSTSIFNFGLLLDPISENAQRRVDLLEWLSKTTSAHIEVYLNPSLGQREEDGLPLKRFYRNSLQARLQFNEDGAEVAASVKFVGLPLDPIYTMGMEVHQSWLVRPHESRYDLDNIHLASLSGRDAIRGVEALFRLDYLVVEGHAREAITQVPPRGLQLELTTTGEDAVPVADTQVVANLGYLQFKAKPGTFHLQIREGRGREIYNLDSVGNEGWDSPLVSEVGDRITLAAFDGVTLYPRFSRQPGMEKADVLEIATVPHGQANIVDKVSQFFASFTGHKDKPADVAVTKNAQADINIFTVASGHLYERFASIMILSVLRHTNHTVKFWFIENFLSPSFLEFIPHFAEAYGFQYELVTYKWPSWLRAQKEKQRIIWGYKILFLDVLFPMDLKKVIFVDADQIVRTDLMELVELDLQGAPYGYTPMGDDNEDMEGFRFWKTGYWKDFLRGRPYHISALYVVDLVRFRQLAAGDRLRGQYQGLSADPHSLANLDQDLPNNLQFEVPIFSLDKDWLWCETWCSKDRLDRAKTIDLCQNPLTKEPKLARARQIPEWSEYDGEIAKFARSLAEKGLVHSDAAAIDVDALAGVGTSKTAEPVADTTPSETETLLPSEATADPVATSHDHIRDEL